MATRTIKTTAVVGTFEHLHDAQTCVNDLLQSGFRDDEIGFFAHDHRTAFEMTLEENKAAEGAAIGVAAGAGTGALWAVGIAAGLLPAIGPVIAGGMFASILASAVGGAAVGGLVGALIGLGIPEAEATEYEAEVRDGKTVVTVNAYRRVGTAAEIIRRHNGWVRRQGAERIIDVPPAASATRSMGDEAVTDERASPRRTM